MKNKSTIARIGVDHLKEYLSYDLETGVFNWKIAVGGRAGTRIAAGSIAGSPNKEGYRYITIERRSYRASNLAWLYMTGKWPSDQIDHKNHNTSDDRWSNLRLATQSQNKANCRTYKKKSCILKGVQAVQKRHSIRYRAVATKDGIRHNLGNFDTELEAHLAYVQAATNLHGQFACDGMGA